MPKYWSWSRPWLVYDCKLILIQVMTSIWLYTDLDPVKDSWFQPRILNCTGEKECGQLCKDTDTCAWCTYHGQQERAESYPHYGVYTLVTKQKHILGLIQRTLKKCIIKNISFATGHCETKSETSTSRLSDVILNSLNFFVIMVNFFKVLWYLLTAVPHVAYIL